MTEIAAPAAIAASTPSHRFPVLNVAQKPDTAPTSIVPCTPRLRIPDRSVRISPTVAYTIGVPNPMAAKTVRTRAVSFTSVPPPARAPPGPRPPSGSGWR